jgi:hypothetical protein
MSPSRVDFRVHSVRGGGDEFGRVDFHRMLTALIQVTNPTATEVRADPGDWGIDTYVGKLTGRVSIWQSKYFYDRIGKSQQAQIRESFASAMNHAAAKKYRVESWTLCMPATLSAPERRWWERKVKAWRKDYPSVRIDLWDEPTLRGKLLAPDAAHVFAEFYGPARDWSAHPAAVALPSPAAADAPDYEDALFMRQLEAAGATETDAQRLAYFSAELLARDVAARAVPAQLEALRGLDHEVHATWEERFNDPATAPTGTDYGPSARRLLAAVLRAVRNVPAPPAVPALPQHLRGLLHRVVEDGRAGWVWDWRDVAEQHRSRASRAAVGTAAGGSISAPAAAQARP